MPNTVLIVDDEPNIVVPIEFLMEQNVNFLNDYLIQSQHLFKKVEREKITEFNINKFVYDESEVNENE